MIKTKKDLILIITYTIVLFFAFVNITTIMNFLGYIFKILSPFILGLIIAFVLNVLIKKIEDKWLNKTFKNLSLENKRAISVMLSLTLVIGLVVFIFFLLIPQLSNTVDIFRENVPVYQENINKFLDNIGVDFKIEDGVFSEVIDSINNYISVNKEDIIDKTLGIASNVVSKFVNITVGIVFAIYLLLNKEVLLKQYNKFLQAYLNKKQITKIKKVSDLSNRTFAKFVTGQCLEALIIGVLCFIGMLILRLPYATTISVLVGFTALIPVFGAFIGTFIGAFLIFMVNPVKAIIFVIFVLVLQQLEGNLIYPKVVGKSVGLPSIWVLAAVTIGASVSGIIGMLVSVPLCSILYSILSETVNGRLRKKAM